MFEINDVFSKCFLKIPNMNITNSNFLLENVRIICIFLLEKCENLALQNILTFFQQKNYSVLDNVVGIYLTSLNLNDIVRLTML